MTSDAPGLVRFWHQLRRRRVVRLFVIYLVASWLVLQVVDVVFPMMGVPAWADRLVLALLVVGLVVGLVLAWTFDVTPAGVVRTPGASSLGTEAEEASRSDPMSADAGEGVDTPGASGSEFSTLAIAVLPFVNLSRDPDNEYFSDGITEDILTQLSRIEDLHVVSRTSVMGYKGTSKQIREIARELEVGSVLEGSVRRVGERVRVSAQLIDASTDKHLWAETYDRDLVDIFEVQSAIAETLAGALRAKLTPEVVRRIRRHPTESVAAYDHFLRGREGFRKAAHGEGTIAELEKAVALDPDFAAAYGALAGSYVTSMYWHGASSTEMRPKATQAMLRAIELDPENPMSWLARGLVAYHFDWEWDRAVESLDRAIELEPEDADLQLWRGHCLGLLRRFDEALTAFQRGVEIDPQHIYNRAWIAFTLVMRGQEADRPEAERIAREAIARDPSHHEAQQFLGWAFLAWGRFTEAAEQFSICYDLVPSPFYTVLRAYANHAADPDYDPGPDLDQARGPLEAMGNHAALAVIAVIEGDIEGALDALDEGADKRSPIVAWYRSISIISDALGGHPRFAAFNERIFGAWA